MLLSMLTVYALCISISIIWVVFACFGFVAVYNVQCVQCRTTAKVLAVYRCVVCSLADVL